MPPRRRDWREIFIVKPWVGARNGENLDRLA